MFSSDEEIQLPATPKHQQKVSSPTFGSANAVRIRTDRSNQDSRPQNTRCTAYYAYDEQGQRSPASSYEQNYRQDIPPLARKGSNMITGLRTELMNIKTEVTKMMVPRANEQPARQFRCDRSDTSSVSELSESVERCSRNLKTKVSVRDKFVEMELESLQAELKSFKRKYHSKKEQHKEEVDRLNRKIQLLQDLLQQNEVKVEEYKADINEQLKQIQQQLVQANGTNQRALTEQEVETLRLEVIELEEKLLQAAQADKENSRRYEEQIHQLREQLQITADEHLAAMERLKQQNQELVEQAGKVEAEKATSQQVQQLKEQYDAELEKFKVEYAADLQLKQEQFKLKLEAAQATKEEVEKKLEQTTYELQQKDVVLAQRNTLLAEKVLIIRQLQQQLTELQAARQQLDSEEEANYELCEKLLEKESEIVSLKEVAAEKAVELEKIQNSISEIAAKCELIYSTSEELSAQKEQLSDELNLLREQLELKNNECNGLIAALEQKEYQLNQLSQEDVAVVEEFKVRIMSLAEDQYRLAQEMESKCQESDMQEGQIRHLSGLYNESLELLKRKDSELEEIHCGYEARLKEAELQIQSSNGQLQQQQFEHRTIVEALRSELNSLRFSSASTRKEIGVFDDALKEQIEQVKKLKHALNEKNEELHRMREQSALTRNHFDNLKAQTEIDKLKWLAERKNIQVALQVECQNLKNQLDAERRASESMNSKFRFIVEEVKKKDDFIQKHIVQRRLTSQQKEDLEAFFHQYRLEFPVDGIKDKINSELQEIMQLERNNRNLLSELCLLREQLQQTQLKAEQTTAFTVSHESVAYPVEEVIDLDEQPFEVVDIRQQEQYKEAVTPSIEQIVEVDSPAQEIELKPTRQSFSLEAMDMKLTDQTASLIGMDSSMDRFTTDLQSIDYE